jgi:hypothetical protein
MLDQPLYARRHLAAFPALHPLFERTLNFPAETFSPIG